MKDRIFTQSLRVLAFLGCAAIGFQTALVHASECDASISQRISEGSQSVTAFRQEAMQQVITPPPAPSMIANTPCMSKSLQNVTNQFSNMPEQYIASTAGGLLSSTGLSASGIMNQFFQAGMLSLNKASQGLQKMMDFQGLASEALGGVLGALGVSSDFSDELCGMMADVVVNFLQCQMPIKVPQVPSFGSLNLMPSGCAGNAMREALYVSDRAGTWDVFSQPMIMGINGTIVPGNAADLNIQNRLNNPGQGN